MLHRQLVYKKAYENNVNSSTVHNMYLRRMHERRNFILKCFTARASMYAHCNIGGQQNTLMHVFIL